MFGIYAAVGHFLTSSTQSIQNMFVAQLNMCSHIVKRNIKTPDKHQTPRKQIFNSIRLVYQMQLGPNNILSTLQASYRVMLKHKREGFRLSLSFGWLENFQSIFLHSFIESLVNQLGVKILLFKICFILRTNCLESQPLVIVTVDRSYCHGGDVAYSQII